MDVKLLLGVATFCGTIIGVGVFALPYVVSQVGFWPGIFYLILLTVAFIPLYLLYGEALLRTKKPSRLPGLAEQYLGKWGKIIISFSTFIGLSASLICYVIAGGGFLSTIIGADFFICGLIFWFFLSLSIIFGLKSISQFELFILFLFIITLGLLFFICSPHIRFENFSGFHPENLFLPYGVMLFSMYGLSAIPALRDILKGEEKKLKKAILIGAVLSLAFYCVFIFIVVGVSGSETTEESIQGLIAKVGDGVILLGAIFGIMSVSTSFLTIGIYIRDVLLYDFKARKWLATVFVCAVPLIGLLLGVEYLVPLMGFIGSILGAFECVVLIFVSKKSKIKGDREPEYQVNIPNPVLYLLCVVFIIGFILEIRNLVIY